MTDTDRKPDYVRACLVWTFPLFAWLCVWAFDGMIADWPAFIAGTLSCLLLEIVVAASWGFWTGRLR